MKRLRKERRKVLATFARQRLEESEKHAAEKLLQEAASREIRTLRFFFALSRKGSTHCLRRGPLYRRQR